MDANHVSDHHVTLINVYRIDEHLHFAVESSFP